MLTPTALALIGFLYATSITGLVALPLAWWQWNKHSNRQPYEANGLRALTLTIPLYPTLFAISKAHWTQTDTLRAEVGVLAVGAVLSAYAVALAFRRQPRSGRAFRMSSVALCCFYSVMCGLAVYASFHHGEI